MNRSYKKLVTEVLSLPTAPYHEEAVDAYIREFAKKRSIPVKADRYGNLLVRYRHGTRPKPVALSAHMDHPGFSVLEADGRDLTAEWLGGCDPKHFPGSRVTIVQGGRQYPGKVTSPLSHTLRHRQPRTFTIRPRSPLESIEKAFGFWGLKPVEFDGDRISTKAADNLAGCIAILGALDQLHKQKAAADLWGVFTRAEESGLVGAGGIVDAQTVPRRVPIVVLEASKALPGAEIGNGPVIRVGDRLSVFDPKVEYCIHELAQTLQKEKRSFQFQRQLMSGGTCEASLYVLHGYTVGALAFPLGNYHNQGKRWPAEEYISASDTENMIQLCTTIALNPPSGETRTPIRKRFEQKFKTHKHRLSTNL